VRLAKLAAFKAKYGHCNVRETPSSEYKSLSQWCSQMRVAYKKLQEGKTTARSLSQDQIVRLEALGFKWIRSTNVFEKRLAELLAFKAKHGHCNALTTPSSENYSLGQWCNNVRMYYKKKQKGNCLGTRSSLSQDQIVRLEALGFDWRKK